MKIKLFVAGIALFFVCKQNSYGQQKELVINFADKGASIAPSMYGVFFEEISHAGDGGLYAELVKNRSFEELEMPEGYSSDGDRLIPKQVPNHITGKVSDGKFQWTTEPVPGWQLSVSNASAATMLLTKEHPKFNTAPNNLRIDIKDPSKPVMLINEGYWGMGITKDDKYHLRTIIRNSTAYNGKITIKLLSEKGDVLASAVLKPLKAGEWQDAKAILQSQGNDAKAKLAIEFQGKGTIWLDYVSLFPEKTFNNRQNGLRPDVAAMIAGLKPSFMRWPGGCVVEGISIGNRFEWKKTLGDPASRPGEYSTWGYRCSYGFGFNEYMQFCEDIGADAMFVCSVGIGCQFRMGDACAVEKVEYYLNDCMDAIEYALGDKTTKWGAKRIASGHPKPFPLKYVEIGNENWGDEYDRRFDLFYTAIKKRYPQLTLISNHGITGTGKIAKTDMVDPHWYVSPEFFFNNTTIFDSQPRGKYTAYVGEYACNQGVGAGNMYGALSEAAFISGMERNGDLVKMSSYAPLLENSNNRNWAVNLIWLNSSQVMGRSSYYVQKMAAENKPDYNLKSNITMSEAVPEAIRPGSFGFGTWDTQVEFKAVRIVQVDKNTSINLPDFVSETGSWNINNDIFAQTSLQSPTKSILKKFSANDYILEFKARKTGGSEGFMIYFGMDVSGKNGFVFNVAGWNNLTTAVEVVSGGNLGGITGKSVSHSLQTNKWYDVKVVFTSGKASLYMDGQLIITYDHKSQPKQFFSSGYDNATGDMIVKVVNATNATYSQIIKIEGAESVDKTGKVISLTAENGEAENSFEHPEKIIPKENRFDRFGKVFNYDFAPFSYTILRIPVK